MQLTGLPDEVSYQSIRTSHPQGIEFGARYRPVSAPYKASPGSLEHFLTERYCLYAMTPAGRLLRAEVHHHPWPLQQAEADISRNDLLAPHGLSISGSPALLHFSRRLDVVVWPPGHLRREGRRSPGCTAPMLLPICLFPANIHAANVACRRATPPLPC